MTQIDGERLKRIDQFRQEMIARLNQPKNVAKTDWRDMVDMALAEMMRREVTEVRCAIVDRINSEVAPADYRPVTRREIANECLDVAAFAFMLWDNSTR